MKKRKTAAELMADLRSDPGFLVRQKIRDEERKMRDDELARAEAPLVKDLRAKGFRVDSVYDLVNRSDPYPDAISILLEHLDRDYPTRITEGIVRALTVPEAAGIAVEKLIELFRHQKYTSADGLKWVAGNALRETLTGDHVQDVIELVRDPSNGEARSMLPFALAPFMHQFPDIVEVLVKLKNDPQIGHLVAKALRGESPVERD